LGLPDGHTRATVYQPPEPSPRSQLGQLEPLTSLLSRRHADTTVAARPLGDYATAANGVANSEPKENR
jgi:hypothetical protein